MGLVFDKNGNIIGYEVVNPLQGLNQKAATLPTFTPVLRLIKSDGYVDTKTLRKLAMLKAAPSDNTRVDSKNLKVKETTVKIKLGQAEVGKAARQGNATKYAKHLSKDRIEKIVKDSPNLTDIQLGLAVMKEDIKELQIQEAIANQVRPTISQGKSDSEIAMIYGSVDNYERIRKEKLARTKAYEDYRKSYETNSKWASYIPFFDALSQDELSKLAYAAGLKEEGKAHNANAGVSLLLDAATTGSAGVAGTVIRPLGKAASKVAQATLKASSKVAPRVTKAVIPAVQYIGDFAAKYPRTTAALTAGTVSGVLAAALNEKPKDLSSSALLMASKHNEDDSTGRWWKIILATVAGTATGYLTGNAFEQQIIKRFDGVKAPFFRRLFRSAEQASKKHKFLFQGHKKTLGELVESYEKLYGNLYKRYTKENNKYKLISEELERVINDEDALKNFVKNNKILNARELQGKEAGEIADKAILYLEQQRSKVESIANDITQLNNSLVTSVDNNENLQAYMDINFDMLKPDVEGIEGLIDLSTNKRYSNGFDILKLMLSTMAGAGSYAGVNSLYPESQSNLNTPEYKKNADEKTRDSLNTEEAVLTLGGVVVNQDSATRAADSTANAKDLQELQYTYPVVEVQNNSTKQPKAELSTVKQPKVELTQTLDINEDFYNPNIKDL